MTPLKQIRYWKKKISILKSWRIYFAPKAVYKGQAHFSSKKKTGTIYGLAEWRGDDGKRTSGMPKDYIFHELLHGAIREMQSKKKYRDGRNAEEMFVQDICKIIEEVGGFE